MNKEVKYAFQIRKPIRRLRRKRGLFSYGWCSGWIIAGVGNGRIGKGIMQIPLESLFGNEWSLLG